MVALTRKNVPLREDELEVVARVRAEGSDERAVLEARFGIELPAHPSEAETLRAVLKVGFHAIEEKIMAKGYAELAEMRSDEDRATVRAIRDRAARLGD